jgi:hypothetical protein
VAKILPRGEIGEKKSRGSISDFLARWRAKAEGEEARFRPSAARVGDAAKLYGKTPVAE